MTGLEILAAIISIASSALQIGVLMRHDGTIDANEALDRYISTASQKEREVFAMQGTKDAITSILTISPQILITYKDRLDEAIKIHANAVKNAQVGALERAYRQAANEVCEIINAIKLHNKGFLPHSKFISICQEYQCGNCQ
jgi:uncharacterized protein YjgD (DUF1641 family)